MPLASGACHIVPVPPKQPRKRARSSGYGRVYKLPRECTASSRASTPSTGAPSCASDSASSSRASTPSTRSSTRASTPVSARSSSSRASSASSSVVPLPPINTPHGEKPLPSVSVFLGATPRHMEFLDAASLPPTPLPSHSVFLGLLAKEQRRYLDEGCHHGNVTVPPLPPLATPQRLELQEACLKVTSERANFKKRDASSRPPTGKKATEKRRQQLEEACLDGDVESAKKCRLPRAMLSEKLSTGELPLHHAVKNGHFAFVDFLVQRGVDINAEDEKGRTALQIAAANNDKDAMCRLVELGAEVKAQDNLGLVWLKSSS